MHPVSMNPREPTREPHMSMHYPRKTRFHRSRSPFPAGDKEENINKHTPTISRSLIKIMNTHLTPNLNPSSAAVRGRAESIPMDI